jgi:hypothetical protein
MPDAHTQFRKKDGRWQRRRGYNQRWECLVVTHRPITPAQVKQADRKLAERLRRGVIEPKDQVASRGQNEWSWL